MTQPPAMVIIADIARQTTLEAVQQTLTDLTDLVTALSLKVDQLMTQDATILALAQGIQANDTTLATALVSIQKAVGTLQEEVAAGGTAAISQSTLDALTAAKTGFDTALATAVADAAADTPAPPVPPVTGA